MKPRKECTLVAALLGMMLGSLEAATPERALAEVHLQLAKEKVLKGHFGEAQEALDQALALFPEGWSDTDYLQGQLSRENKDTRRAIEFFQLALAKDDWEFFSQGEGALSLSRLLSKTRAFAPLLKLYETLPSFSPERKETSRLVPTALWALGQRQEAYEVAQELLAKNPSWTELYRIVLSVNTSQEQINLLRVSLTEHHQESTRSMLQKVLLQRREDPSLLPLVIFYEDLYGRDSYTTVFDLIHGRNDRKETLSIFMKSNQSREIELLRTLVSRLSQEERVLLRGYLLALIGKYTDDWDSDGYPDERLSLSKGILRWREFDLHKDGTFPLRIVYADNRPISIHLEKNSSRFVYSYYQDFPYLRSFEITQGTERKLYEFSPGVRVLTQSHSTVPFGLWDFLIDPLARQVPRLPSEKSLSLVFWQFKHFSVNEKEKVSVFSERHGGGDSVVYEDRDTQEGFDTIVHLRDGEVLERYRDPLGGGVFYVEDLFRDGKQVGVAVDIDGDGVFEYRWDEENGETWDKSLPKFDDPS